MITVSIVTYKTEISELKSCLDSLDSPLVRRIFIVDNSRMQSIADFCKGVDKVEYIGSDNVGYGAGHNIAIRKAMALNMKYHLVLNSDVYFGEEVLPRLVVLYSMAAACCLRRLTLSLAVSCSRAWRRKSIMISCFMALTIKNQ